MSGPSTQAPKLQPRGESDPRKVADVINIHAEMINTGQLQPYTVVTLPDASLADGMVVFCSDETNGPCLAVSSGGDWKILTLGAVAS